MSKLIKRIKKEVKGIRPTTLQRSIILDLMIGEYIEKEGKNPKEVIEGLTPKKVRKIVYDLDPPISSNDTEWLIGLSDRTLKDYIEVIKHFKNNSKI